jgi:hypothetical protein
MAEPTLLGIKAHVMKPNPDLQGRCKFERKHAHFNEEVDVVLCHTIFEASTGSKNGQNSLLCGAEVGNL